MIQAYYVRQMARYNAWQNDQIIQIVQDMDSAELTKDRGAFFGSIHHTLNHLLWGDTLWMSRFDPSIQPPDIASDQNPKLTATMQNWQEMRVQMDRNILGWAHQITDADLAKDLEWYSGVAGKTLSKPIALCITHFFNHQTHHRGQVHAMLTSTGSSAPVSDLFLMPEET